jgi:hypothetical protein
MSTITRGLRCSKATGQWLPLCYGAFLGDFPDLTLRLGGGVELPLRAEDYVVCSMALCVILIQKASGRKGGEDHPYI